VILADGDGPLAGFQLLWRPTRLGRIGYVSKGPVAREQEDAPWEQLTREIIDVANRLNLQAVIVQPPDWAPEAVPVFRQHGFADNHLYDVIRATWLIDLTTGWDQVEAGFRKGARRATRQSIADGFVVREGAESDLPDFFYMMNAMCRRLRTRPNPGTELSLRALWTAFHRQGLARLLIACHADSKAQAGLLLLRFGDRLTAWKQACDSTLLLRRPDPLLFAEAIRSGIGSGCRFFDFAALHPEAARALERGDDLSRDPRYSRDFFHVGFGGQPLHLPDPLVWFRSNILRRAYRLAIRLPGFGAIMRILRFG
jgi:hypothetical protein